MTRINCLAVMIIISCFMAYPIVAPADESSSPCEKLGQPVAGPEKKFSITGDANGFAAFTDIGCAIKWRNTELCATELASFDLTATVYDYYTGKEIEASKAFFAVDTPDARISAFSSRNDGQKYIAEKGGGQILDYDQLAARNFN